MKFRMAFGIYEADVEMPGDYDVDTDEFLNAVAQRLMNGGIRVVNVVAT